LLGDLDHLFDFLVFLHNLGEALAKALNLTSHGSFLLLSDLKLSVLFSTKLGLLDGVDALIDDVLSLTWQLELSGEVGFVEAIDVQIDLWQVRRVILLEVSDFVLLNLLELILRHEVDTFNAVKRLKLSLLLDHELINRVDKDETIVAGRHNEPLIVGELGRRNRTDLTIVLLDRHVLARVRAMSDTDLTVGQTHDQEVAEVVVGDVPESSGGWHLKSGDRALALEVTKVEETSVLALGADDELVFLVGHVSDRGDAIRIPIFLLIFVILLKLSSEAETSLALLLFFVLLLVLLHLELHHLHSPDAMGVFLKRHLE